jgi:DNA repair photolyase
MWMDYKYKVTQELLRIFNFYRYPHIVFTRSDLAAHDDYLAIYDRDLISIQYSISGDNDKITKLVEPGAPTAERRLKALKRLNEAGIWTTVRLNPFFPMHPDGYFSDEESIRKRFGAKEKAPAFPWFSWDLIEKIKNAGTPSVLAGVVRLSPYSIAAMSKATGVDLKSFFKPENVIGSHDRKYSDREIAHYYLQLKIACQKNGLRFSTCYIGNGEKDYFQYQNLWTNKSDCCDAAGNVPAFTASSQQILPRVKKASPTADKGTIETVAGLPQSKDVNIAVNAVTP